MVWILVSCTYIYILKKKKEWFGLEGTFLKTIQFQPLVMGEDTSHQIR